jgi:hypothetical protein
MADDCTACATAGRPAGNHAEEERFQNLRRIGNRPPYQGFDHGARPVEGDSRRAALTARRVRLAPDFVEQCSGEIGGRIDIGRPRAVRGSQCPARMIACRPQSPQCGQCRGRDEQCAVVS